MALVKIEESARSLSAKTRINITQVIISTARFRPQLPSVFESSVKPISYWSISSRVSAVSSRTYSPVSSIASKSSKSDSSPAPVPRNQIKLRTRSVTLHAVKNMV